MDQPAGSNSPGLITPQSTVQLERYYDLRWRVLRAPWEQPRGSEKDELESEAQHSMIVDAHGQALAVGRVHFNSPTEAQVRFMAVEPTAQGRGLGSVILSDLEARARAAGATRIVLNARENVRLFYEKHGFTVTGPAPTLFGEVKHVRMSKEL